MSLLALAVYGAGVASFLAPCVLPLVPVYLTILLGSGRSRGSWAFARATAGFVAGFSGVFVALGALAGAAGGAAAPSHTAQRWLTRGGGVLVIVLALLLLGAVPARWQREWRAVKALPRAGSALRPLVLGVVFGAAWTPCVGPLLAAALLVAARAGTVTQGAVLLGCYALGVATPFLAVSLALDSWPAAIGRLRAAAPTLNRLSGLSLVVLGALLATGNDRWIGSLTRSLLPGAGLS